VIHPATARGWLEGSGLIDKYLIKRPVSFALTFALAHLSTFYWERPWTRLAKEFTPPSPTQPDHYRSTPDPDPA